MTPLRAVTSAATPTHPPRPAGPSAVKATLTPNRTRRVVENDEYAAFLTRVIHAYARRVARGDIDAITLMCGLSAELDTAIAQAVTGLRATGYSWADIGSQLGVTRQAAYDRWGHPA